MVKYMIETETASSLSSLFLSAVDVLPILVLVLGDDHNTHETA